MHAKLAIRCILILASLSPGFPPARGASLYTETFDSSTGGWQQGKTNFFSAFTNSLADGNPGGCLKATFPVIAIPQPASDSFAATGRLNSANFVGDYRDVEALLLGFDFYAENIVPTSNGLQLIVRSGSNFVLRKVGNLISSAGAWHSIRVTLLGAQEGKWENDTALFSSIVTNVTRVEVEVTRNDLGQQTYRLDNVFLARLPTAAALGPSTNQLAITWLHLRAGDSYRMEGIADLASTNWVVVSNFTATSATHIVPVEATNLFQAYRMVIP